MPDNATEICNGAIIALVRVRDDLDVSELDPKARETLLWAIDHARKAVADAYHLDPCPFCGGPATLTGCSSGHVMDPSEFFRVSCTHPRCKASTNAWQPAKAAVNAWNRRRQEQT